jgi:hypothetical protein
MARKKSFIPTSYPKYNDFYKNTCQYVNVKCTGTTPEWTHIPADERTALNDGYADWYTYYARIKGPHTPADNVAVKAAYTRSRKVLARFIQVWFRGFPDIVTDEDLKNMDIPPIDRKRTPIGKPPTRPSFRIVVKNTRLLFIYFQDEGSESRAIPYGMNGAVISWAILDAPPTDQRALTHTELATRSPHHLHFEEEDRGKTVYICLQWQNESGVRGDPTEIQWAIVP